MIKLKFLWGTYIIAETPIFYKAKVDSSKFSQKEVFDFFLKKRGVGKMEGVVLKK